MSTCFGCEIQTVYSRLNRTEITENRHQKLKPNRKKSEPWQPYHARLQFSTFPAFFSLQQTPQDRESEAFMESLRTNIKNLTQRMKYVTGKGRHVSTDTITQVRYFPRVKKQNVFCGQKQNVFLLFLLWFLKCFFFLLVFTANREYNASAVDGCH